MNICTIIAKNYVSQARVLAESFLAKHPQGACSVLVVDDFDGFIDPADESFELLGIDEIGLPDPEEMAAAYDVTELSTAVKPWLLRHLLERDGVDAVTYLDPDIWIADPIEEIDRLAREHGVVLTPHFTAPLPRDGLRPSEEDILIAGAYNLGFISLGAGETATSLLDWWSERLERHCVIDPAGGRFVDQRWIDLVPGIWPVVHVLRDPAYNVAYWNLPTRTFEQLDGDYVVDGELLRFFHFSGFDPLRPGSLSKHQNRIDLGRSPALAQICGNYAEALLEHGYRESRQWPYGWDVLPNGVRLDRAARSIFRQALEDEDLSGTVFNRRGASRFVDHLNASPSGNGGVSRYARAIHGARPDLQSAFPEPEARDAAAFNRWMHENADALRISRHLLPSTSAGSTRTPGAAGGSAKARGTRQPSRLRGALGVNLAGYLDSELGVGEAARQVRSALEARDVPTASIDVPVDAAKMSRVLGALGPAELPYDFNLICVNADMLPSLAEASSNDLFDGRHSAGLWFWEVEDFPIRWKGSFDYLDEVWVASEFVAEALRPHSPVPVTTVRVPVAPLEPAPVNGDLGLPGGFRFLFVFDFRSVFRRKNPLGLIEAFGRAFDHGEGASLVIKSMGGEQFPDQVAELSAAAAAHPDVQLVDTVLSPEEKNGLIASCDCYVSLHRSEGLGLTMAEAMYFGKPVIATAYSGNLDFMTEENSYPIDYSLTRIGDEAGPYAADGRWAEPDLSQAAERMREVFDDREGAAKKGSRAAADIRATHSPAAAGKLLEARLTEIRRERVLARLDVPGGEPHTDPAPGGSALVPVAAAEIADQASGLAQLHHLLRFEQPPPRRGAGRLRQFAKRLYMRILRPYSSYQQRIDLSTRQAFDELGGELAALERRSGKATEEAAAELESELSTLSDRLKSTVAELRLQVGTQSEGVEELEDAVADADTSLIALSDTVAGIDKRVGGLGERECELRAAIEANQERLGWAIDLAEALGERVTAEQNASAEHRELSRGEIARAGEELRASLSGLSTQLNESLERDRVFVDALRQAQDRFATRTDGALAEVRAELGAAASLVDASRAVPYMAENRFPSHEDPMLGKVIGFSDARPGADGYSDFEDLFRGPEEMIRERQSVYVGVVDGRSPLLDAGCGRGEFLELMAGVGVEARGVDLDRGMVERCRRKGLRDVEQEDMLDTLKGTPKGSLGCVFSAQVIEHLGPKKLQRLLSLALSRLQPGGLMIVETVNPHSARALKTFWIDPTHRQPLFPETMLALFQLAGFESAHAFCPLGSGDWERDRLEHGEYAIVATTPSG